MLKKTGETLIEVIIAVALIVLVSVPISSILLHSSNSTAVAAQNAQVSQVSQNKMEDIKNQLKINGDSFLLNQQLPEYPALTLNELNNQLIADGSSWSEDTSDKKYRFVCTVKRGNPLQDAVLNSAGQITYPNPLNSPPPGTTYLNLPSNNDIVDNTVSLMVYDDSLEGNGIVLKNSSNTNLITHISFTTENQATIYFNTSSVSGAESLVFSLKGLTGQYHLYCVFLSVAANDNTVYNPNVTVSPYSSSVLKVTTDYISDINSFIKDNDLGASDQYWFKNYLYKINIKLYKITNSLVTPEEVDTTNCLGELNSGCMIRRKS